MRDVWALRLQRLQARVTYDSETDTEQVSSSQAFSSQSESETTKASTFSRRSRNRETKPKEDAPSLVETLAICCIGSLLLRTPVTVGDLLQWVHDGELLYYRASREVPLGMRERLPGRFQELLEPQTLLNPESLHQCILETLTTLNTAFGMTVPAINSPIVLYRWIRILGLPIETFAATQRLARLLDITGEYLLNANPRSCAALRYPEAQLMGLLVVATKLLFPFDDIERYRESANSLSIFDMDWDVWVKVNEISRDTGTHESELSFPEAFAFDESDCLQASDEKLDAYLDWYESNIASEDIREHGRAGHESEFRRALFVMFPVHSDRPMKSKEPVQSDLITRNAVREVQRNLIPKRDIESSDAIDDAPRTGCFYRRYRNVEELPKHARVFFDRASKLVGLSLETMVQAVFHTERELQKVEERLRKGESVS